MISGSEEEQAVREITGTQRVRVWASVEEKGDKWVQRLFVPRVFCVSVFERQE